MSTPLTTVLSTSRRRRLLGSGLAVALGFGAGLAVVPSSSVAVAGALAPLNSCAKQENGDPVLNGMTRSPASVNVTSASKTVTFTLDANDTGGPGAASGISNGYLSLSSPDFQKSAFATLKKNSAGKWIGKVTIPRWTHGGTWKVNSVSLNDKAGNYAYWSNSDLAALGFPNTLPVTSTADDTDPRLTAFTFKPGTVDTRTKAKTVTFTAKATDAQSGVQAIYVSAGEPNTTHRSYAYLTKVPRTASTYKGKMLVGKWQTNGSWQVDSVQVYDRIGNSLSRSYAQLGSAGFKRKLKVVSGTDTAKPTVTSFARTPGTLDVRTSNKTVRVSLRAKDRKAGVSFVSVSFSGASSSAFMYLSRKSGTVKNGVWKGSTTIRKCGSASGDWKGRILVTDLAGNQREYTAAAMAAKGWPSKITVQASDQDPPSVDGPSSVTPTGNITVQFDENVNGINANSVTLRRSNFPTNGPVLPGTWTCVNGSGASTSCATGTVRAATFDPTANLAEFESYVMEFNPEHQLAVTDLAGNPFDREQLYFSVFAP